jgi:serine/threonine-protein kinase
MWVLDASGSILRFDGCTGRASLDTLGLNPQAVAAQDRLLWVANGDEDTVTRVDVSTGRVVGKPIKVGALPSALTVDRSSVWVANQGDGTVTQIDARTGTTVGTAIRVGSQPSAIAVDAGSVWVANEGDNTVTRLEGRGGLAIPEGEPEPLNDSCDARA